MFIGQQFDCMKFGEGCPPFCTVTLYEFICSIILYHSGSQFISSNKILYVTPGTMTSLLRKLQTENYQTGVISYKYMYCSYSVMIDIVIKLLKIEVHSSCSNREWLTETYKGFCFLFWQANTRGANSPHFIKDECSRNCLRLGA